MRQPRNWKKHWKSYAGHLVQGVVVGWLLPDYHAAWGVLLCYLLYQVVEWLRFRDVVQGIDLSDWPSRDIADFLAGVWIGVVAGALYSGIGVWT